MKTLPLLAAGFGLLVAGAGPVAAATPDARAEVIYVHPEHFTDIKDSSMPSDKGSAEILDNLRVYLVKQADRFVPKGCKLTLTFTDIDLAGDFEPWRGPQFDNVRIIKPIYPPHFKFTFVLTDAAGRVIRQGQEDLLDDSFEMRITLDTSDPLHFEKQILQDWMRRRLRGAPATAVVQ
jgi:hypothetical protein